MAKKKPSKVKIRPGKAVARTRGDILSISMPGDSLAELDACGAELSRRGDIRGVATRSATLRYAIASLHSRLFWRNGQEQES